MMSESDFACWLAAAATRVEQRLAVILHHVQAPVPLAAAMRDALLDGGKRLRPSMVLAVAPDSAAALDAGCALEMMHCYSLVHDDLPCMDNADMRRNRPACHKKHGEAMALLAGDCLQTEAFAVLAGSGLPMAAAVVLAKAGGGGGMGGGQALDLQAAAADEAALRRLHEMKTGALFAAAVQLGLLCRPHVPAVAERLHAFAAAFGRLFQIANDIKDAATDAALGKTTYVTVLGESRARHQAQAAHAEALAVLAGDYPLLSAMTDMVKNSA